MASPKHRREPRQERSRERVAKLLDAAAAIVVRAGLDALTTNAIAEEAGLPVGTLYQFFANREAVLEALLERQLGALDERFRALLHQDELPLPEAVDAVVAALSRAYLEIPALSTLIQVLRADPRFAALADANNLTIAAWVTELVERRAPGVGKARARAVATATVVASDAVLMAWLREVRAGRAAAAKALLAELEALLRSYLASVNNMS
jgi:AcrR family transcriptional regulator